ncbi:WD40 repeat domain-containing protein [Nodularia sphaerocarpa]|uniref:WD40 repeat domain-containing protein n=3 Tax=Nodularia sphaerocarpa TaxID=137816 RepID=UPI001EFAAF67|nr:WD40 repeat domain-containing protein [Nodularia sphaerocarpa]MDB9374893.1 WD40 repeat domain-containing protein [Nodularia sphaerocarpa CS-585]ULP71553.1 Protein TolB [Nodularia sphaerocarpa UHCC 0038]
MKFTVGLTSLALFSLSSVAPSLAASQLVSRSAESSLSSQSLPSGAKTIQVANSFSSITQIIHTQQNNSRLSQSSPGTPSVSDRYNQLVPISPAYRRRRLVGHRSHISGLSFSPNSNVLVSSSEDGTIRLWNVSSGSLIRTLTGHRQSVFRVNFSPNGRILASGDAGGVVKLWDMQTGKEIDSMWAHGNGITGIQFSPNAPILASSSNDGTIKIWSLQTGKRIHTLRGKYATIRSISFSPDGRFIVSSGSYSQTLGSQGSDGDIKVWDVQTGSEIRTLRGHKGNITRVRFSPNGRFIASSGQDGTIRLWNAGNGAAIRTFRGHGNWVNDFYFSQNGDFLVSTSRDKTLKFWDVETGENYRTVNLGGTPGSLTLSPNGYFLAFASNESTNDQYTHTVTVFSSSSFDRQ